MSPKLYLGEFNTFVVHWNVIIGILTSTDVNPFVIRRPDLGLKIVIETFHINSPLSQTFVLYKMFSLFVQHFYELKCFMKRSVPNLSARIKIVANSEVLYHDSVFLTCNFAKLRDFFALRKNRPHFIATKKIEIPPRFANKHTCVRLTNDVKCYLTNK